MSPETERQKRISRVILGLVALVVPVLMGYMIYLQWRAPVLDFSLTWFDSDIIYQVVPGGQAESAGLRAGDVILAVDGVPFAGWHNLQWGQTLTLEIERDGAKFTLTVPTVPMAQVNPWRLVGISVIALIFWGTSTLLLRRRFQQVEVRLLFLLCQIAVLLSPQANPYPWPIPGWMAALAVVNYHLTLFFLPLYHLTFPVTVGTPRQRRWVLGIILGLAVVSTAGWLSRFYLRLRLSSFYAILVIVVTLIALAYVYLRRATADDRRRLRLIVFSTVLCVSPIIFLTVLPSIAGVSPYMPRWQMGPLLAVLPLAYLYATARHNLFGIDRLLNRALVYAILSLGIFALYLGPFLLLYRFLPGHWLLQALIVAGLTPLIGWSFDWIRTRVQRLVDHLFYSGWYDYPGVVETVSEALTRSLKRGQLADVLTRQVPEIMQLHEGWLWIGEPGAVPSQRVTPPQLQFPLLFQDQVRGLWTVGPRRDGDDFSPSDRRILKTLARQAESALSNVLLVETLRSQLDEICASRETLTQAQRQLFRSREEERARLARDLHDGPIQALVGLNLQLGLLLARPLPPPAASRGRGGGEGDTPLAETLAAMRAEVRDLLSDLRQVCTELRPPMLDTLGLGAAVRALAEEWSAQHGVAVHLKTPADATLRPLPGEVAVNLYRVVQEALTNVARHAEAQNVTISLAWENSDLILSVQDDGQGFDVSDTLRHSTARGHFGLVGMRERVDLIGGQWTLESAPGQGTTVRVVWQMDRPELRHPSPPPVSQHEPKRSEPMADLTERTLGKYHLLERLGRGGMAEVYRAYQPGLERQVAVKVMHGYLAEDAEFVGRFEREARAVAALHHPHIVQVYDFDVEDDVYYMVMEYVEGETLKARLQRLQAEGKRVSPDEVVRIFRALCDALDYAHARDHVHRDIKPGNVMFDGERLVLTDFGLATIIGSKRQTIQGAMLGTPAYMSPEQGQGEPGDARSDIYSLGVLLYEMVTGQLPYDADTPRAIILKHLNAPLPLPSLVNPDVSPALEQVILKALAKSPDDRFQSAGALADALEAALERGEVPAGAIPLPSEPLVAPPRGHPLWRLAGAAALTVAALIAVVLLVFPNLGRELGPMAHLASTVPAATSLPPITTVLPATAAHSPIVRPLPDTTDGIRVFNDQLSGENMTEAQFEFAATHYAGTQKMLRSQADHLRAYNPDFVVLNYRLGLGLGYREITSTSLGTGEGACEPTGKWIEVIEGNDWVREFPVAPQDRWFFQWQGQWVLNCEWGWYLMDLDNVSWRDYWAGEVLRQLRANDADGIFADSLVVPNYRGHKSYNPPLPELDETFEHAWSARIEDFIAFAQTGDLADYYFIADVGRWVNGRDVTDYSGADGVMVENFASWGYGDYFDPNERDWQLQMDRILGLVNQDKIVLLQQHVDPADVDDRMFLLGSYLLTKGRYTYLNLELALEPEWFPEYEIPIGRPVGVVPANVNALWRNDWGLYARTYSNGLVLVNPTGTAQTVNLDSTYYQATPNDGGLVPADGDVSTWTVSYTPVTSVTLEPNQAVVLLNSAP